MSTSFNGCGEEGMVGLMCSAKYFCTGMLDIAKYSHWALNTPLYTHFTVSLLVRWS